MVIIIKRLIGDLFLPANLSRFLAGKSLKLILRLMKKLTYIVVIIIKRLIRDLFLLANLSHSLVFKILQIFNYITMNVHKGCLCGC